MSWLLFPFHVSELLGIDVIEHASYKVNFYEFFLLKCGVSLPKNS